jgi:hypothetical protein
MRLKNFAAAAAVTAAASGTFVVSAPVSYAASASGASATAGPIPSCVVPRHYERMDGFDVYVENHCTYWPHVRIIVWAASDSGCVAIKPGATFSWSYTGILGQYDHVETC